MNKKFIAGVLALSMVVTSGITVFAGTGSEVDYNSLSEFKTVTVSGGSSVQEPKIKIEVPVSVEGKQLVINPYNINYDKTAMGEKLNGADISGNTVISAEKKITNSKDSDVSVKVQISDFKVGSGTYGVTVSGNLVKQFPVTLVGKSIAKKENKPKSIFLKMTLKGDKAGDERTLKPKQDHKKTVDDETILTGSTTGKKFVTIAPGGTGSIKLDGDVNANPIIKYKEGKTTKTAQDYWTDKDNVTISYKITFTPIANQ